MLQVPDVKHMVCISAGETIGIGGVPRNAGNVLLMPRQNMCNCKILYVDDLNSKCRTISDRASGLSKDMPVPILAA